MEWGCLLRVFSGRDPTPRRVRVALWHVRVATLPRFDWKTQGVSHHRAASHTSEAASGTLASTYSRAMVWSHVTPLSSDQ